ncbi:MAG: GPR endopeptidase [Firmicutes bacterium]|nr:GPR endopeptidase [Bacillota bacterium]
MNRRYMNQYRRLVRPEVERTAEDVQWDGGARTDLALEAHELVTRGQPSIPGLHMEEEREEQIKTTRIRVESEAAARSIGKLPGTYATLEVPDLRHKDPDLQDRVAECFAKELERFIKLPPNAVVLVVGLGNWNVTPDALGPLVVESLFVTRHLFSLMPEVVGDGFRSVCALAPGVLGLTGIETSEVVKGVIDSVKPDLVIAIDALAARSIERVNSTIQIADSGIQPGAGVGNRRKAINKETLGVDVLAIGVPTVLDAATIASDAMDLLFDHLEKNVPGNGAGRLLNQFTHDEKRRLISEVLQPLGNNLMVTPKEIDEFVDDVAHIVAMGLNLALHPAMDMEDAKSLTH